MPATLWRIWVFSYSKSDDRQNIYVFLNSLALDANAAGVAFIESDTLIM